MAKQDRDYSLNIVGESYRNKDGSSRQKEIKLCRPGERITLVREPDNKHDPEAVAVYSSRGVQVGYLSADHCSWIGEKIDKGREVRAIVERVNGGTRDKPSVGLLIRLNYDGEEPKLANEVHVAPGCLSVFVGGAVVSMVLGVSGWAFSTI